MRFFQRNSTIALFVVGLGGAWLAAACSDDDGSSNLISSRRTAASSSSGASGAAGDGGTTGDEPPEEQAFDKVEPDLLKNCGHGCHDTGGFTPPPPVFLAGATPAEVYKSVKAHPGIVTKDVYQSILLTKGAHAGPGIDTIPGFQDELTTWLQAESIAIQQQALPTTPAFTVTAGENDVDLTPAATSGISNVHLKFTAALVGTILSLTNVRVAAPAGQDVHVVHPIFVRVLSKPNADGDSEIEDPVDSFSNFDDNLPGGQETQINPGSVLFTSESWKPFDLANDKLRVEVTKLEPGKVAVITDNSCADPTKFANDVLPTLQNTQTSAGNNCAGCHGDGLAGLALNGNDPAVICNQVLTKLSKGDIGSSLIVKKVSNTPGLSHGGGAVADTAGWKALFVDNAADFFKP